MAENEENPNSGPAQTSGGPRGTVVLSPDDLPNRTGSGGEVAADSPWPPALVGLTPPFTDSRFRLQPERTRIGRDPENDVVLNEADVSLEHARILRSGGEWRAVDPGSTNGTFINGERVHQGALQYGDQISFGPATFVFAPGDLSAEAVRAMQAKPGRHRRWWIAGIAALLVVAAVLLFLR